MVSAAHLPGYRSHDGLLRPDLEPEADAGRRSRAIRYLRRIHDSLSHRIRSDASRGYRHHRWCRRPDGYLPLVQAGSQPDGCNRGIRLFLHGVGTGNTAAYHASAYQQERTPYPHETAARCFSYGKSDVPDYRSVAHLFPRSVRPAFAGYAVLR